MRFTSVLCKYHLGRLIKHNWFRHGKQIPYETFIEDSLAKQGIKCADPKEFILPFKPLAPRVVLETENFLIQRPQAMDKTHPDWHDKYCWQFDDHELLVQGTDQAQLLTKTILIKDSMPDKLETIMSNDCQTTNVIDSFVEKTIKTSTIFDAEQKKLPKLKDPTRPAWNFPRVYGITHVKKASNLSRKMLQMCEVMCGKNMIKERQIIDDATIQVPIVKDSITMLLNMKIDLMIASKKSPSVLTDDISIDGLSLPDLRPMAPTVGLQRKNIYQSIDMYPIAKDCEWINPHTIFFYHDPETVINLTELPVRENQLLARSLIKSFTAGAGCARQKYGPDFNGDLPEPLTIQCVQTNGQSFHFSVLQLNTLNINDYSNNSKVNYWWSMPQIDLYKLSKYETGKPIFEGYNPEVFRRILAFYKNS
ncbi:hypothetical protein HCN44_009646 [Aphidius gifuensis]|uniref:Large ribosomal subunit protein mL37 n=1 Tax=Aphidius gifuensis TaxID=684658 RepID=A0A834Y2R9_APHGI|nr:39S ribosomal protein L37, mitochondrial [Aphidius gifuensis]KAF7998248.1 hypothetical protein HCN44_009646 [Aphidius gifuensis]